MSGAWLRAKLAVLESTAQKCVNLHPSVIHIAGKLEKKLLGIPSGIGQKGGTYPPLCTTTGLFLLSRSHRTHMIKVWHLCR